MEEEEKIRRMEETACWDLLIRSRGHYLAVQATCSEELGLDWTLFDPAGNEVDGGILTDEDHDRHGAIRAIVEDWCGLCIRDFTACLTHSNRVFRNPFFSMGT